MPTKGRALRTRYLQAFTFGAVIISDPNENLRSPNTCCEHRQTGAISSRRVQAHGVSECVPWQGLHTNLLIPLHWVTDLRFPSNSNSVLAASLISESGCLDTRAFGFYDVGFRCPYAVDCIGPACLINLHYPINNKEEPSIVKFCYKWICKMLLLLWLHLSYSKQNPLLFGLESFCNSQFIIYNLSVLF